MKSLIVFIITFAISYLLYIFFVILRKKNKKFNSKKLRVEESFLITKYKLDMKKINYRKFLFLIYFVNSIIIGITVTILGNIDTKILWQLMLAPLALFPMILISYTLIGKYYIKKGCVKNV